MIEYPFLMLDSNLSHAFWVYKDVTFISQVVLFFPVTSSEHPGHLLCGMWHLLQPDYFLYFLVYCLCSLLGRKLHEDKGHSHLISCFVFHS